MPKQTRYPRDRSPSATTPVTVVVCVIAGILFIANVAPTLERLLRAATVLVLVVGALALAWKLLARQR